MTSASLPVELYRPIIQHITSVRELYSLLFASRAFHAEAKRSIYHSITLRPLGSNNGDIALVEHLASSPHLATLVYRLNILKVYRENKESYWLAVQRALQQMPNLQHLYIHNSLTFTPLSFGSQYSDRNHGCLLQGCSFRLRSLIFESINPYQTRLLEVHAPSLEEFICLQPSYDYNLPKDLLFPNVKIVGYHSDVLHNGLLEAMPRARALAWTAGVAKVEWSDFGPFRRIRMLDVHLHAPGFFVDIVGCFPGVVYLKCTASTGDERVDVVPADFLTVHSRGNTLPDLRHIYLQIEAHLCDEERFGGFAVLFGVFPALDTIALHAKDRTVQLRKGRERALEDVGPRPDEWKDEKWLEG